VTCARISIWPASIGGAASAATCARGAETRAGCGRGSPSDRSGSDGNPGAGHADFRSEVMTASNKCGQCGLVNFAAHESCRRCGAALTGGRAASAQFPFDAVPNRGFGRRVLWIAGATAMLLVIGFVSLLVTSAPLDADERQIVTDATAILERSGFSREAFFLRNIVIYRSTDNWWNQYVGHASAYAATNFPFEVVTLYSPFFKVAVDDTERAAILLHEAFHLFGGGEETALRGAWIAKRRLGWVEDQYNQTRVWKNTREWTAASVPGLFQCGMDSRSDCVQ